VAKEPKIYAEKKNKNGGYLIPRVEAHKKKKKNANKKETHTQKKKIDPKQTKKHKKTPQRNKTQNKKQGKLGNISGASKLGGRIQRPSTRCRNRVYYRGKKEIQGRITRV